jgi:hypothetical protein
METKRLAVYIQDGNQVDLRTPVTAINEAMPIRVSEIDG